MPKQNWRFWNFLDTSGESAIREWLWAQGPVVRAQINVLIRDLETRVRLERPDVGLLRKPPAVGEHLIELVIKINRVQYRPIGWYGPERNDVTLLVGAIERGGTLSRGTPSEPPSNENVSSSSTDAAFVRTDSIRRQVADSLTDPAYRAAFVEAEITVGLPLQIRAMRRHRNWSQTQLGERTNQDQGVISRLEKPGYGRLTLTTLRRLAAAFDVGLLVRFVPFSELMDWSLHRPHSAEVHGFESDAVMVEKTSDATKPVDTASGVVIFSREARVGLTASQSTAPDPIAGTSDTNKFQL